MIIDVSFITTVKNAELFINETIESVLNQSISNWELIVVDDGSSDDTVELIKKVAATDKRIKLIETGGLGRGHALNLAVDVSKGDFIANIDCDDPSHPQRAEIQSNLLRENTGYALVATDSIYIDENSTTPIWENYSAHGRDITIKDITTSRESPFRKEQINHSSVMFRKEALLDVGKYDEKRKMQFDGELWDRFTFGNYRLGLIPLKLATKRIHPNQSFEIGNRRKYLKSGLDLTLIKVRTFDLPYKYYLYCYAKYFYGFAPQGLRKIVKKLL